MTKLTDTIECGFYRLSEETVFHYAGYECAAWWVKTKVPAGDYPVKARFRNGTIAEFYVELPGTIVEDYFQALYCGTALGSAYDTLQNAGLASIYFLHAYSYDAFRDMKEKGEGSPWHVDVSKLPGVVTCTECDTYTTSKPLCVRCYGKARDARVKVINKRFPTLIRAIQQAGYNVTRWGSIFDQMLDSYYTEKTESIKSDRQRHNESACLPPRYPAG